jgi:hypothetical protein
MRHWPQRPLTTGQGFDVQRACLMLGVSVSGYYDWKVRPPSARALRHAWLAGEIAQVHIDISRPLRTRAEQVGLLDAVRDAAAHEQETSALEWKGSLDLSSKRDLTKIVKAVLSFANRQPDEAGRTFGGCAYLLVGVEPGTLAGVQPIDAATLESSLVQYIGSDSFRPSWSPRQFNRRWRPVWSALTVLFRRAP